MMLVPIITTYGLSERWNSVLLEMMSRSKKRMPPLVVPYALPGTMNRPPFLRSRPQSLPEPTWSISER